MGCSDELACNYDADATDVDDSLCTYPAEDYLDCDGNCLSDADGDGLCDEEEVPGCTDETACNYNLAPPTTMGPANTPKSDSIATATCWNWTTAIRPASPSTRRSRTTPSNASPTSST